MRTKAFTLASILALALSAILVLWWADGLVQARVAESLPASLPVVSPDAVELSPIQGLPPGGGMPWRTESVDTSQNLGGLYAFTDRNLAIDGNGRTHVAYGGGELYYAWNDGSLWHHETVDSCGGHVALTLVPTPPYNPHISYSCGDQLKYAYRTAAGWSIATLDSGGGYSDTSVALEPAAPHYPHISYRDYSEGLKHIWWTGSAWDIELLEAASVYDVSMAIAATAPYTIHVGYGVGFSMRELRHTWWTPGSGWISETVDSDGDVGANASLALEADPPHRPRIVYHAGWPRYEMYYAYKTAAGWQNEPLGDDNFDSRVSLVLETTAPYTPHVGYYSDSGIMRHAWRTSTGWVWEDASTDVLNTYAASIALEPTAPYHPHIVYYDGEFSNSWTRCAIDIVHACRNESGWEIEIIDDGQRAGMYASIALEPELPHTPHLIYGRRCSANPDQNGLVYAHWAAAGWISETVYTIDKVGEESLRGASLVLEPVPPYRPHIVYWYDQSSGYSHFIVHTWLSGTNWMSQTIAQGHYPSLAIASTPPYTLHVAYQRSDYGVLAHSWLSGTTWISETVITLPEGDIFGISLALEPTQPHAPHVAYYIGSPIWSLRHAWWTPGGWDDELVDGAQGAPSLAIAATEPYTLHISYDGSSILKHAWKGTGSWSRETINYDRPYYNDLALEPTPPHRPIIAYCNGAEERLDYIRWTGTEWEVTILEEASCAYPALVLEPTTPYSPHVVYQLVEHSLKRTWIPRPQYIFLPQVLRNHTP